MKKQNMRALFAVALTVLGLMLTVRGLYGFCWSDESFYLTFAQRLWNGQKLIVDEWHPVQFYSVLFYPILSAYHAVFGTEGIYLFARVFACAIIFLTALYFYWVLLDSQKPYVSFLCAALYLGYSRGNIWGLSYYNLVLTFVLLAFCLLLRGGVCAGKRRTALFVLAGVCLAAGVLCVPYFAVCVLLGLLVFLCSKAHRMDARNVLWGVCLMAAVFVLLFLPKNPSILTENLRQILSDPEHQGSFLSNLSSAVADLKILFYWEFFTMLKAGVVFLVGALLPGKWGRFGRLPGLVLLGWGFLFSIHRYWGADPGFSYFTLILFSLPVLALVWIRRKPNKTALFLRLLGAALGIVMAMSSNTDAFAATVGTPLYAIGMLIQLSDMPEEKECGRIVRVWAVILTIIALYGCFYSRFTTVFRDGPLNTLTEVMDAGPAKGIRTTPEHNRQYGEILSMLEELEDRYSSENRIFFSSLLPWGYLATDFPCGAPTAWRTRIASPRLESYYTTHPEDIPQIVVILKPSVGDYPENPTPNQNALEGWFWEYLMENRYEHLEYSCADVYVSPQAN